MNHFLGLALLFLLTFEGVEGATWHPGPELQHAVIMRNIMCKCAGRWVGGFSTHFISSGHWPWLCNFRCYYAPWATRWEIQRPSHNAMSGCSNLPTSIRTPQLLGQPGLLSFWFSLGFYDTLGFVFGMKKMENESLCMLCRNLHIWAKEQYNQMVGDQLLRPSNCFYFIVFSSSQ